MAEYYLLSLSNGDTAPGICYSGPIPGGAVACTEDQFNNHQNWEIRDGSLVAVPATNTGAGLVDMATAALSSARTYVYNNYGILNEATPDVWVTYLKALMAIVSGADTTSTALPTEPATNSTTAA